MILSLLRLAYEVKDKVILTDRASNDHKYGRTDQSGDWAIGRLGDWAIGRLGDWAMPEGSPFVFILQGPLLQSTISGNTVSEMAQQMNVSLLIYWRNDFVSTDIIQASKPYHTYFFRALNRQLVCPCSQAGK